MDFTHETVKNLRGILDRREISALELCAEYIDSIEAMNPHLQSLLSVNGENALLTAKAAQQCIDKGETGALTGIPAVLADDIMTEGIKTTCASKMLENFVPPYDAAVTERLNDATCPLLGKTNLNEFGAGVSPKPGEAVSAGFAPFSLTSDTGGALRLSAALGGLTGLRPTYGRVSRYGLAAFASSLAQIGVIAKTAEDCAIILNTIAMSDPRDATCFGNRDNEDFTSGTGGSVKGLRIAVASEFMDEHASDEMKTAVMNAASELEKQGAELINIRTEMQKYALSAYYIISSAEASSNLARCDGVNFGLRGEGGTYAEQIVDSRSRGFGDEVKRRIMFGNFVLSLGNYEEYYRKSLALRQKVRAEYDELFKTADLILTPTVADNSDVAYFEDIFTVPSALAGLPSISVTCGYKSTGLPIGMLLTGKRLAESTIIRTADCFERVFNPDLF
jgi:aspartyl-tRNA(Asn)/glutamyl-tRNA(Gln) amidotransferase subunit A